MRPKNINVCKIFKKLLNSYRMKITFLKIALLKEWKVPADARVPLTPEQCALIQQKYPLVKIVVQPSQIRCIADADYLAAGIEVREDVSDCDILMGIKEVPVDKLIPNKTYFFFSHTIKKQAHNRKLLQAVLEKNVRLIDYETLTNADGLRVIAFGRWAGIVGAHNGLMAVANRLKTFELGQMHTYKTYSNAQAHYKTLQQKLPPLQIVITGSGRVSSGAAEVLDLLKIRAVSPSVFLNNKFDEPVYTQVNAPQYAKHKDGKPFLLEDFYENPQDYVSTFFPFCKCCDLLINGIFWDKRAPAFFSKEEMKSADFSIKTIADITCDIAPASSIPSTLFASTISEPVFGYNPQNETVTSPYQPEVVDMMTIDNLPSELPIDASSAFGEQFLKAVLDELLGLKREDMLNRATIAQGGKLTPNFAYLQDYADGKE